MPIRQRLSSAYGGPDARLDRIAVDLRSAISPTSSARLIDVLATIVAVGRTRPILAISHDFEGPGQVRRRLPAMSASGG